MANLKSVVLFLKTKNKNTEYNKNGIPWHLHIIQKSALLKIRESHYSLSCVLEF